MRPAKRPADPLRRLEQGLRARLRSGCPTPHDLGEYHLGLLPRAELAAIDGHVAACSRCRAELQQLQQFLADGEGSVLNDLVEFVLQWAAGLRGAGAPALAGVRGEGRDERSFAAGPLWLTVTVKERDDGRRDLLALLAREDGEAVGSGSAWLQQDQQRRAGAEIDAGGNFVVSGLAPGDYDLGIECGAVRIWIRGISL